jgi:hypothetical protein
MGSIVKNARLARRRDVIMAGMTVRQIFLAALPSIFTFVVFGFRFAGRHQVARTLRRQLVDSLRSDTLGHMLREDKKDNYGLVNQNPALAKILR